MSFAMDPVTATFALVAIALLIVIILFMAYFNTLLLIANFAYPNAMLKAMPNIFLSKKRLRKLVESSREEFVESLRAAKYPISSGESDPDKIESAIDSYSFERMKEVTASMPDKAKPFFKAWMKKYDVEALKKVIRAKRAGEKPNISELNLYALDRKLLSEMAEDRDLESTLILLQGTEYDIGAEERSGYAIETALDRKFFKGLEESASSVDGDIAQRVSEFVDMYADISNIKSALRAKYLGMGSEEALKSFMGPGSEVPEWKVKSIVDAADMERAVSELAGTKYDEILRGMSDLTKIESVLDSELLKKSREMEIKYSLDMGPALSFVIGKEMEARNLKAVNRAIEAGLDWSDVEPLLVTEEDES